MNHIKKRDKSTETYNIQKIINAVYKAFKANNQDNYALAEKIANEVHNKISGELFMGIDVERIQDEVENVLIQNGYISIAKSYILYRDRHARTREHQKLIVDINEIMNGYLSKSDWRVNENSNINFSVGGFILNNSGTLTANYWLNNVYDKDIADAHKNADFHIHDLSMLAGYCVGWSLRDLIENGLGGVDHKTTSGAPKHLNTLIGQMVNFIGVLQNEWAGAQAFSSFDTFLAPFIRADKLSYQEVKQQIQQFVYHINTPSRWGSQAPFSNITLDWVVPNDLKDYPAIVGGKQYENYTYKDFQPEMDLINKAFIEVMMGGDSQGKGFSYPIPTYNITEDFNWDSENANLLFQMTGKFGTPYFQNFINSDLDPSDVRSMCCRLQLDKRELRHRGGGLFGADELTGSIGVVTINLPRIGYLSSSENEFFEKLSNLMDLASKSLILKRRTVNSLMENNFYPYSKVYLKKGFKNHFSTIGIVGMNECCLNFMDKPIMEPEAKQFAMKVLNFMKNKLQEYQEITGDLYNLEAAPAEGTSYRLAKHDKKQFPEIITMGKEEPFYTNSTQLPVDFSYDIFEALNHQEELQASYTGGTVFHGFLGESISDMEVCKNLVRKIANNYRIPYFTITPTYTICPEHGYLSGRHEICPICDARAKHLEQELTKFE